MRTSSSVARTAIRRAATDVFCDRGYRAATLEEIGARVGVTRGTVLHHFGSKADLLAAVTDPCLDALSDLLTTTRVSDPPTPAQRRQVITDVTALLLEHRGAVRLLLNDVAARAEIGLDERTPELWARLILLLVGEGASRDDVVRVAATVGAVSQPLAGSWVDFDDARSRAVLIDAAVGVIERETVVPTTPCTTAVLVESATA
jgi:AcrR family transcriptional regulator